MLSRTIAESKKLAHVSERAALVYLLLLPLHDGEGLIESDDVSMLVGCGRFALVSGWTAEVMAEVRGELVGAGLWAISSGPHGDVAEFVGWQDHQRLDKIGRGTSLQNSGETMAKLRQNSGLEGKGREGEGNTEGKVEEEGNGSPAPPDLLIRGKPTTRAFQRSRILRAWNGLFEDEGQVAPLGLRDEEAIEKAVDLGICDRWPTDDQLKAEFRRVRNGLRARKDKQGKSYGSGLAAVLGNLGGEFGDGADSVVRGERKRTGTGEFPDDPSTGRPYHPQGVS